MIVTHTAVPTKCCRVWTGFGTGRGPFSERAVARSVDRAQEISGDAQPSEKARNAGRAIEDHFADVGNMVDQVPIVPRPALLRTTPADVNGSKKTAWLKNRNP